MDPRRTVAEVLVQCIGAAGVDASAYLRAVPAEVRQQVATTVGSLSEFVKTCPDLLRLVEMDGRMRLVPAATAAVSGEEQALAAEIAQWIGPTGVVCSEYQTRVPMARREAVARKVESMARFVQRNANLLMVVDGQLLPVPGGAVVASRSPLPPPLPPQSPPAAAAASAATAGTPRVLSPAEEHQLALEIVSWIGSGIVAGDFQRHIPVGRRTQVTTQVGSLSDFVSRHSNVLRMDGSMLYPAAALVRQESSAGLRNTAAGATTAAAPPSMIATLLVHRLKEEGAVKASEYLRLFSADEQPFVASQVGDLDAFVAQWSHLLAFTGYGPGRQLVAAQASGGKEDEEPAARGLHLWSQCPRIRHVLSRNREDLDKYCNMGEAACCGCSEGKHGNIHDERYNWVRVPLKPDWVSPPIGHSHAELQNDSQWQTAFHGCNHRHVWSIVRYGLRLPGSKVTDSHLAANTRPSAQTQWCVWTSRTLQYASLYCKQESNTWAIIEVRQFREAMTMGPATLKTWIRHDIVGDERSLAVLQSPDMECSTTDVDYVVPVAVLFCRTSEGEHPFPLLRDAVGMSQDLAKLLLAHDCADLQQALLDENVLGEEDLLALDRKVHKDLVPEEHVKHTVFWAMVAEQQAQHEARHK